MMVLNVAAQTLIFVKRIIMTSMNERLTKRMYS